MRLQVKMFKCSHISSNLDFIKFKFFSLVWSAGYMLLMDGRSCADIDECKENPRICNGGKCTNTPGSYLCSCQFGLTTSSDGITCEDIDECATPGMCLNGECDNTLGSFKCRCEEGYSVKDDGPGCRDDDECLLGTFNCDVNAECNNTEGGYECRCREGFTGNGAVCRDINECLTNNGGCDQDAQCINTEGSFKVHATWYIFSKQFNLIDPFVFLNSVSAIRDSAGTATSVKTLTNAPTIQLCARTANVSTIRDRSVASARWVSCIQMNAMNNPALVSGLFHHDFH